MGIRDSIGAPQTRLGYFEVAIPYTNYLFFSSTRIIIIPNSGGGLQWFTLVCGGLSAFHCFHYQSSQILVVICDQWFAVICGRLWSFAVVCAGLRWFVVL